MNIALVTPAAPGSRHGNRNTALRWAALLRSLGHRVRVEVRWGGKPADAMIALHARRSHESIAAYRSAFPQRPLIVVLTGTDLYRDIAFDRDARESLRLATRLVVLQEMGLRELAPALRRKTRVIYQSAPRAAARSPLRSCFEVVVSGHLRDEKDPFRAAAALAHLPRESRLRVTHIGGAMTPEMKREAAQWMAREARYRWLGEVSHARSLALLARSRLMVISSRMEGGANVVGEAIAIGKPVIASRISGNVGMLGRGYPGYYAPQDEADLARLLWRAESDPAFYRALRRGAAARAPLVSAGRERAGLRALMSEIAPARRVRPARRDRAPARN